MNRFKERARGNPLAFLFFGGPYFKIDADIPEAQKEELVKLAQKHSPVFNTIFNQTPVSVQLDRG